jgi:hypothetical protein
MSHRRRNALFAFSALLALASHVGEAAEAKKKVAAQPAVRSRNYGAVQIRTADLTPRTEFDFKTIQWGYGPGYYRGYYGYGPGWGYFNYYRPYAAYYPYYAYRPYAPYAYGPGYYGYYGRSYAFYGGPVYSYPVGRAYADGGYIDGGHVDGGYGGCYHW